MTDKTDDQGYPRCVDCHGTGKYPFCNEQACTCCNGHGYTLPRSRRILAIPLWRSHCYWNDEGTAALAARYGSSLGLMFDPAVGVRRWIEVATQCFNDWWSLAGGDDQGLLAGGTDREGRPFPGEPCRDADGTCNGRCERNGGQLQWVEQAMERRRAELRSLEGFRWGDRDRPRTRKELRKRIRDLRKEP